MVEPIPDTTEVISFTVITDKGLARLREAAPTHLAGIQEHVTSRLTPAELDTLGRLLRKLLPESDAVPVGDWHLPSMVAYALAGEVRADDARMLELLEPYRPHRARVWRLIGAGAPMPPRRAPRARIEDRIRKELARR